MMEEARSGGRLLEELVLKISEANDVDPALALNVFRLIAVHSEKGGLTDSELEELTGVRQIEIRRVLRLLYEARIINLNKERNPKQDVVRYAWYIDSDALNFNLIKRKKMTLEKLKARLSSESSSEWYVCPLDKTRLSLSEAFDSGFQCPRCGSPLELVRCDYVDKLASIVGTLEEEIAEDERSLYAY